MKYVESITLIVILGDPQCFNLWKAKLCLLLQLLRYGTLIILN